MATASRILVAGCPETTVDLLRYVVSDLDCEIETAGAALSGSCNFNGSSRISC